MKKKITAFCLLLFFSLLPMGLLTSCDRDTKSYLEVKVLDELTREPVKGVTVELYQNNCDPSDYNYQIGSTDSEGIFHTSFIHPGIFSIRATLNLADGGYRRGTGTVRLIEGGTKETEVTLETQVRF